LKRQKTIIIAEAGVNHNGSIYRAKQMIDVAVDSGVDLVKFQTFNPEALVTRSAEKAEYQKKLNDKDESQFKMLKKLELNHDAHYELINHCEQKNIRFLSTAFDHDSIDFLAKINMPFFKIPSGEITNLPYLRHVSRMGKPIVMSSGMSTLEEVRDALNIILDSGVKKDHITILHCNSGYPTPMKDVNLKSMLSIREELGVAVGYSDHTLGIEVPVAAVALGASIIEKHFTLDRTLPGPDHSASLEPKELSAMVQAIHNIELALGDYNKCPQPSEIKNITQTRKSLVAACPIKLGEEYTEHNLAVKRPGLGISPMRFNEILGRLAPKDFDIDELIEI
jgi:N,N'-diacetyllegionaminate synthase